MKMKIIKEYKLSISNFKCCYNSLYSSNSDRNPPFFGFYSRHFKYIINDVGNSDYTYNFSYMAKRQKIAEDNFHSLKALAYFSDITSKDIAKDIINKFNRKKSILFILDNKKYNTIDEIDFRVFSVNNSLHELGETVKLYSIQKFSDLQYINYLKYIVLGEKEMPQNNINMYNRKESITLEDLIDGLMLTKDIIALLEEEYDIATLYKSIKDDIDVSNFNKKCKDLLLNIGKI